MAPSRWATAGVESAAGGGSQPPAGPRDPDHVSLLLGRAMLALVSGDVIRPSLGWLLAGHPARSGRRAGPQP